ncbi:hypothetical protein LIER_12456 [Lithospermum erythrorhizon]|uniref:GAG-pre-integrase domain-containing protein n=1 Tax=Lithospermum erythrorhizon TaxID=34254 RepID=A0AAV3PX21_LITER
MLFHKWSKLTQTYTIVEEERKSLTRINMGLAKIVEDQKVEIGFLEGKIQSLTKGIKMMNSSTKILDEIQDKGKKDTSNSGIGCTTREAKKKRPVNKRWVASNSQHEKRKGHIAPYCYKIYGKSQRKYFLPKLQWVRKESILSNVVFTSLKATAWEGWYFDSGCSRHMTGNKSYLIKIEKLKGDCVTFGGGEKGKITGKGLKVAFTKETCDVNDNYNRIIMKGTRFSDNCYLWTPHPRSLSCRTKEDVEIWHRKLGHTNYRNIQQLISKEAVVTTRVLKLLHMDLMGPMQVESIGGKKYIYVCVDDFSRDTWVEFIREKSDAFDVFQQLAIQL